VTGRQILTIAIICCSVFVIGYIVISPCRLEPHYATLGTAEGKCEIIAIFLKKYYAELYKKGEKTQVADIVQFIENQRTIRALGFSSQAPVAPYLSPLDFGVYLLLPEKLKSDLPTLIAYTTRIKRQWKKQEQFLRIGLFLTGTDINVVTLPSEVLEKIVGEQTIKQAEPDIYYWPCKEQYLRDLKQAEHGGRTNS